MLAPDPNYDSDNFGAAAATVGSDEINRRRSIMQLACADAPYFFALKAAWQLHKGLRAISRASSCG